MYALPNYQKTDEDMELICRAMGDFIFGNELEVSTMRVVAENMILFKVRVGGTDSIRCAPNFARPPSLRLYTPEILLFPFCSRALFGIPRPCGSPAPLRG